ncbi:MAG TPA: hypothetical protein VFY90_06180, partial [Tepidiformaceae bacterium]|nr:hypothetical protein [Tepidiformaceae bacterium]
GPDAGKTFSFSVTLSHDGDRITGSGDGMTLQGSLKEQVLTVTFQRPGGGEGVFVWSVLSKDLLVGDFRDHTAANGGPSTMTRIS